MSKFYGVKQYKKKGDIFSCQECATNFYRCPSEIKNGNNKFCSRECASKGKKPKPRKGKYHVCGYCRKNIYRRPSLSIHLRGSNSPLRKQSFCSRECYHKSLIKGKELRCIFCGNLYYRSPAHIRWRGSSFCSRKCMGAYQSISQAGANSNFWKGGISEPLRRLRSSSAFKEWRKTVFERDDYTCQKCGSRSKKGSPVFLHPHHIKEFALYENLRFELSNGITYCDKCHKKTHGLIKEENVG